jgi:ABC-type transporter Mla MlaB component
VERWQDPEAPGKLGLKLSGTLTIGQAAGFKDALLAALEAASELLRDLSGVREIDLTGLQLLCATHQSALAGGKRFSIKAGADPVYLGVVRNAGFLGVPEVRPCERAKLTWSSRGTPLRTCETHLSSNCLELKPRATASSAPRWAAQLAPDDESLSLFPTAVVVSPISLAQ